MTDPIQNSVRIVQQIVRRITNEILGAMVLNHFHTEPLSPNTMERDWVPFKRKRAGAMTKETVVLRRWENVTG